MQVNRSLRCLAALGAVLMGSAGIAGCSAGGGEAGAAGPERKREQWLLPLDEFEVYNTALSHYAEQLLLGKCLTARGYEWPVPWKDSDFQWPQDMNRVGLRLFNVGIAERWGYHHPPFRDEAEEREWEASFEFAEFARSYAPDADFDRVFEECRHSAIDDDSEADVDARNYRSGLAVQAGDLADQYPSVREGLAAWRECLAARVDFEVPRHPLDMPPSELGAKWGLEGELVTLTAPAEEIRVAVADAECQESSGFSEALYDAEWKEQLILVEKNRDTLERMRAHAVEHEKKLHVVIAENAPPAP